MDKITEKTLLPISLFGVFAGGIIWLTTIFVQGNANAESIVELKQSFYSINKMILEQLTQMNQRLARIEGKMESKK